MSSKFFFGIFLEYFVNLNICQKQLVRDHFMINTEKKNLKKGSSAKQVTMNKTR